MTHFLRDADDDNLVDIEEIKGDFRVVVAIVPFAAMLLSTQKNSPELAAQFVCDMDAIQCLRQRWWEMCIFNRSEEAMRNFISAFLDEAAKKLGLFYVTD